jgi:hypothetical protein
LHCGSCRVAKIKQKNDRYEICVPVMISLLTTSYHPLQSYSQFRWTTKVSLDEWLLSISMFPTTDNWEPPGLYDLLGLRIVQNHKVASLIFAYSSLSSLFWAHHIKLFLLSDSDVHAEDGLQFWRKDFPWFHCSGWIYRGSFYSPVSFYKCLKAMWVKHKNIFM